MTDEQKLEICKVCNQYKYEVFPNLYWCTQSNNAVKVVVTTESCPVGKW